MKTLIFVSTLLLSSSLFGQDPNANKISFPSSLIEGNWILTQIDTTFGHKTELKFTFTKARTFVILYFIDSQVKEKYVGQYKIVNGNILQLAIQNKPSQSYKIIQASLNFLKLKEKDNAETLQFIRD